MTNKDVKTIHIKEEDFFRQILDLAYIFGWRVAHFRPARTKYGWRTAVAGDGQGFPDCVMVRRGIVLFAELKSEKGKLSEKQDEWMNDLKGVADNSSGVMAFIWRPSDWEVIVEILR